MQTTERHLGNNRNRFARPLIALTLGLELAHLLVLLFFPHPVLASNIFQICLPLLTMAVSLHQGVCSSNRLGRLCWNALACACTIWATAQGLFVYYMYFPERTHWAVRPDDALWLLFGLPLLIAVASSHEEADRISWLDRGQAILFFVVLYLLVFSPSGKIAATRAYLIQNLALVLCCFLRLPASVLARERRFFIRLALFLFAYSLLETVGEILYAHGWQVGSLVDLVWTTPFAILLVLILQDATRYTVSERQPEQSRLLEAVNSFQGLSVAALTFLSMAVSALLLTREPLFGGIAVASSFVLFALRTNVRERLWTQAHKRLEHAVLQDPLTGIGNRIQLRRCLAERLAETAPKQKPAKEVVLLFADLDRFKQINDSLGHALGDRLLIEVGHRLREASSPDAIVCRLGGDEFVVMTSATDAAEAEAAGSALLDALHTPFHLGARELRCTASIGVVLAAAGENADHLLRTADHAMYRAKQLGKNRVQLYDSAMREQMSNRWQLELDLRACLDASGLQVAFQPIYSVEEQGVCGFEALARWSHPVLGDVPPSQFIPLAEETGLIVTLGSQIIERACSQVAAWNLAWNSKFSLSVNVSPRQFADSNLVPSVLAILDRTGLHPSLLRLEITETALLTHEGIVKHTLEQARAHGIRISLDDFGTGYSSLSFLLSLPVDEVKVDRSFVSHMHSDPDREELVRTVIHLGHSLGKRVVAEGVETEQDLLGLAQMGCECVQGYLISKPLLPAAMEADLPSIVARNMPGMISGSSARQRKRQAHAKRTGWPEELELAEASAEAV